MQTRVYLDANATHPLLSQVKIALREALSSEDEWGNPSSLHSSGRRSKKILNDLRKELELASGLKESGWVLCSGATESLNLALAVAKKKSWPVLYSAVEHSAVLRYCEKELASQARSLTVAEDGSLDLTVLDRELKALDGNPCLLVLQTHNNESGLPLLPLERQPEFLKILSEHPQSHLLMDMVQSLPKADAKLWKNLLPRASYVVASGHKAGAMIGIGALWVREGAPLFPQSFGGLQEGGRRAGTEAVWNAFSWLEALKVWRMEGDAIRALWKRQRDFLKSSLKDVPGLQMMLVPHDSEVLLNTLLVSLPSSRSDLILQKLDLKGISISAGSACRSGITQSSHVLRAMGCDAEWTQAVLRISMPVAISDEHLDYFVKTLKGIV
jgi:cysteine desulfurase